MSSPNTLYHSALSQSLISPDDQQQALILELEKTYLALINEQKKRSRFYQLLRHPKSIKGNYIWGGVGIGKTLMMDYFYNALPFDNKMRVHFHAFMRDIHQQLKAHQGEENPLKQIAQDIAKRVLVICFDELIVTDIADAMILRRLFEMLIKYGVCLVITSNTKPDDLYLKGLQRISFLPAIDLIKKHTVTTHIMTKNDYRLQHLLKAGVYHVPHDNIAIDEMEKCFELLCDANETSTLPIMLYDRQIKIIKQAGDCIWFDFHVICHPPRSQHDYLALAEQYKTIFISNIPIINPDDRNAITLFIRMIDVFYDRKIRLICSAATTPNLLYQAGEMKTDFGRTQSRLFEMQSEHYF